MTATPLTGVEVLGPVEGRAAEVLTPEALAFVARLHRQHEPSRRYVMRARARRRRELAAGRQLGFLPETEHVREGDWRVAPVPPDLRDRRVEITGPVDRKMVINALNSGARGFMADFEDATSPTWDNVVDGQVNLIDAVRGTIEHSEPDGRTYRLADETATLLVRPRGWHLPEAHLRVDGSPVAGALVDFGLFAFHNARELVDRGSGPYLYLPKLEGHVEAGLWHSVLVHAEGDLGLDPGTFRSTVLIETVPAAFEMEEILHELRDYAAGLNAGRWDYIFSMIKCFADRPEAVLPDRRAVTMTVPFMRAYTELLVRTCHRRGAHAMGGMSALVPSRADPEATERAVEAVRADKRREAGDGFDGTWVAHPDLVPVARAELDAVLGERPNQVDRQREDVEVGAAELLHVASARPPGGGVTEEGLRNDVDVALRYLVSWLGGRGAVAIHGLMEDAATAEIARSQLWQWRRHGVELEDGRPVTAELVRAELSDHATRLAEEGPGDARVADAVALLEEVALGGELPEFLTLPAYRRLVGERYSDFR